LSDLRVDILDQVGGGDVYTRVLIIASTHVPFNAMSFSYAEGRVRGKREPGRKMRPERALKFHF